MAVKSSGSLSITTDIVGEFGGQAPHALSEYYRNGANVPDAGANSAVPTSGQISFADFYGAVSELGVTINADTTDLNLLSAVEAVYGTQSAASVYRVSIANGVTIGASSSAPNNAAITWGDFPDGSTITLVNDGDIEGVGGAGGSAGSGATAHSTAPSGSSGSSGGDAIYANYSNQTMNITNNGNIRGGGGGAGGGGGGGKGGDGITSTPASYGPYQYTRTSYGLVRTSFSPSTWVSVYWNGTIINVQANGPFVPPNTPFTSPINFTYTAGGFDYNGGPYVETYNTTIIKASVANYGYQIRRKSTSPVTTNYDGGNGGAGGVGGVGQGYNQSNTNGSSGSSGSTGSGSAGDGGTGGTGGNGGTYGNPGAAGSTGSSGAAGNNPPAASSGGSGGAGGTAGRYIVKGSNTVTFTGSGTTAGGVA